MIGCIDKGKLIRLLAERAVTRLGRDITQKGILNEDSIEKSIRSLIKFKASIEKYKTRNIFAVGTSALRDAGNSREFIEEVKARTGISIDIISGDREAELTVLGILGNEPAPSMPAFITDIGGGSTEWIFCDAGSTIFKKNSLQMGAVRLHEQYTYSDPPSPIEIENIKDVVFESVTRSFLESGISTRLNAGEIKSFVATGGTATTVAAIDIGLETYDADTIHLHTISCNTLKAQLEHLSAITLCDRAIIKGLEPERADIIIPGIIILLVLMEILKTDTMTVSDFGLLEGILLSTADRP
ncbi:MAG: hypothetical protein ACLQDH_15890 [Dissulfurispiraceae bacterium]